jgi:hypothetical protein
MLTKFYSKVVNRFSASSMACIDKRLGLLEFPKHDRVIGPQIAQTGQWEPIETNWILENLSATGTVINVGANCGYFTRLVRDNLNELNDVIAVEPNPELIYFLLRNIQRGKCKNVEVLQLAMGAEVGRLQLFQNFANYGDSRVFDPRMTDGGGHILIMDSTWFLGSLKCSR